MRKIKIRRIALWMKTLGFKVISFTFLILCFLLISKSSFGQKLTVEYSVTKNVTCSDSNDGEISVTVTGNTGDVEYSLNNFADNITATPPFNITGLGAGVKTLSVRQVSDNTINGTCTITLAPKITLSTSGQNWSCWNTTSSIDNCNGNLTIGISGGQSPYSISITGPNGYTNNPTNINTGSYTFDNLCSGDYNFTVSDGCTPTATTTESVSYTINLYNAAPTGCVFPEDYYGILDINSSKENLILTPGFLSYTYVGASPDNDTVIYNIDPTFYTSIEIEMTVTQYNNTWDDLDFIELQYKNKNSSIWNSFYIDKCTFEIGPDGSCSGDHAVSIKETILLGNDAMNIQSIMIRCKSSTAGKNYTIGEFIITGKKINGLELSTTGDISNCNDRSASEITHVDGPVTWYCKDDATPNIEFSFNRSWKDGCGYIVPGSQKIAVGKKPTFKRAPRDTVLSFCHFANLNIQEPLVADNCAVTPSLQYRFYEADDKTEIDGYWINAPLDDYDFLEARPDETLHLWWKVTDAAGLSDSMKMNVVFTPEITISITPNADDVDFCSGEEATFIITAAGGTGVFNIESANVSPASTSWEVTGTNKWTYSTSSLTTSAPNLKVTCVDVDDLPIVSGGCPPAVGTKVTFPTAGTPEYTVHPKISTGAITRNP